MHGLAERNCLRTFERFSTFNVIGFASSGWAQRALALFFAFLQHVT